jgi:type IV pilus assembly protein PilA
MRRLSLRASARGITLIELMIIVTIVGILAALGLVGYRRYILASKTTEANYMISAIRVAEEAHYSDQLSYLNVSQTIDATYPSASPGKNKTAWGAPCGNCNPGVDWNMLGISAAPVQFGYAVVAGDETCGPTCKGVTVPAPMSLSGITGKPWYVIHAAGNPDGNGPVDLYHATGGISYSTATN